MWKKTADGPIDFRGPYLNPDGKTEWQYEIGAMVWSEPGKPDLYMVLDNPPGGEPRVYYMTKEQLWPEQSAEWPSDEEIEAARETADQRQREADWYYSDAGTRFRLGGGR